LLKQQFTALYDHGYGTFYVEGTIGPKSSREQLDRLKELSQRKGEPMTYYLREGVALVLDKYAEKSKRQKTKS
jgi:hypothetical protein